MSDQFYGTYRLKENKTYERCSVLEWSKQHSELYRTNKLHVGHIDIDAYTVSTVWLGVDHSFSFSNKPILFETMVLGADYQDRYSTWEEAEEGHKKAVQWVLDGCKEIE